MIVPHAPERHDDAERRTIVAMIVPHAPERHDDAERRTIVRVSFLTLRVGTPFWTLRVRS
ncbi:hypothetical protein PSE10B_15350 [Pseudomonas amygdali pv. eriobotryae]|nr:hypothetical protein PSE10B_15350 [Pseudomonas amygdali pv. eriobotryae]